MDKLKTVIKEYGRWSELETYIDRIETHIEIDFNPKYVFEWYD